MKVTFRSDALARWVREQFSKEKATRVDEVFADISISGVSMSRERENLNNL